MAPLPVSGKTALITGGGSGICYSFAALVLSKGCNVVIADLSLRPEAQALVDRVQIRDADVSANPSAAPAAKAIFHKTDVTDWAQLEAAVDRGIKEFGQIDIFVPGAGVYEPSWSSFWFPPGSKGSADGRHANTYKSLDINLTHPIRLTQLGIAHLLARKNTNAVSRQTSGGSLPAAGAIILLSSVAAQAAGARTPIYQAAKAAVSSITRALGVLEDHAGIRVAAVAPGLVLTPLWTDNPEKMAYVDETKDAWATPEEVAEAMLGLIEKDEVGGTQVRGGVVLEVGKGSTRIVQRFHDPGPKGLGFTASGTGSSVEELMEKLKRGDWGGEGI